jgi:hypothetical protein
VSKRAQGWYDMERRYRHNKVPEPPVVTKWQQLLSSLHMREEEALMAAHKPGSVAEATLRQGLRVNGLYRNHYVPELVLQAFGWQEEVEARVAGEWMQGRPRKERAEHEERSNFPLLEKVQS